MLEKAVHRYQSNAVETEQTAKEMISLAMSS